MKPIHAGHDVFDYNDEAKAFIKFLDETFNGKYKTGHAVFDDDGSYKPKSGKYVQFESDSFYMSAHDLALVWDASKQIGAGCLMNQTHSFYKTCGCGLMNFSGADWVVYSGTRHRVDGACHTELEFK